MSNPNLSGGGVPVWTGQATMVEQARAMAEVHAMMMAAQQVPRQETLVRHRMRDACSRIALAERAFYRYPRSGEMVEGATIHLARELARCWGNITFDVKEMSRRDDLMQSEMMAYAWDVETMVRSGHTFIVPHKRMAGGKIHDLIDMRDIYENNANAGARRMREAILAVLPTWYKIEAQELCRKTLEWGNDQNKEAEPFIDRKSRLIDAFREFKVTLAQLEAKLGVGEGRWTPREIATMSVIYQSLRANETTVDQEFPREQAHAADIGPAEPPPVTATTPEPAPSAAEPSSVPVEPDRTDRPPSALLQQIAAQFEALQFEDAQQINRAVRDLIDWPDCNGLMSLTHAEAVTLTEMLAGYLATDDPVNTIDAVLDAIRNDNR